MERSSRVIGDKPADHSSPFLPRATLNVLRRTVSFDLQINFVEARVCTRHFVAHVVKVVDSERTLVPSLVEEILITTGWRPDRER